MKSYVKLGKGQIQFKTKGVKDCWLPTKCGVVFFSAELVILCEFSPISNAGPFHTSLNNV